PFKYSRHLCSQRAWARCEQGGRSDPNRDQTRHPRAHLLRRHGRFAHGRSRRSRLSPCHMGYHQSKPHGSLNPAALGWDMSLIATSAKKLKGTFMKLVSLKMKRTQRRSELDRPSRAIRGSFAKPTAAHHQIHTYVELRQQIHDDLRIQHPEWIQPDGKSP